jgi:hypothetical protein
MQGCAKLAAVLLPGIGDDVDIFRTADQLSRCLLSPTASDDTVHLEIFFTADRSSRYISITVGTDRFFSRPEKNSGCKGLAHLRGFQEENVHMI